MGLPDESAGVVCYGVGKYGCVGVAWREGVVKASSNQGLDRFLPCEPFPSFGNCPLRPGLATRPTEPCGLRLLLFGMG